MMQPDLTGEQATRCQNCFGDKPHLAHGWCSACYFRWYRAGQPDTGPPPPPEATREEYVFLRDQGYTPAEASELLSISEWSRRRYERLLREGALVA